MSREVNFLADEPLRDLFNKWPGKIHGELQRRAKEAGFKNDIWALIESEVRGNNKNKPKPKQQDSARKSVWEVAEEILNSEWAKRGCPDMNDAEGVIQFLNEVVDERFEYDELTDGQKKFWRAIKGYYRRWLKDQGAPF